MTQKPYRFEFWQDGINVAVVEGLDLNRARTEIMHYAVVYRQDGPCEIRGEGVTINFPASWRRTAAIVPQ